MQNSLNQIISILGEHVCVDQKLGICILATLTVTDSNSGIEAISFSHMHKCHLLLGPLAIGDVIPLCRVELVGKKEEQLKTMKQQTPEVEELKTEIRFFKALWTILSFCRHLTVWDGYQGFWIFFATDFSSPTIKQP
eukprot:TRINITY_DN7069_c0_g1_i1.p1 TRINITY_DN7069_c0_g1~~TRINITY_DN7069_c0_g1_i1.p1  ORF type:complete len:137 (-),score=8.81 TRINITY_DN7069_c0_g1_i1:234-644(-)